MSREEIIQKISERFFLMKVDNPQMIDDETIIHMCHRIFANNNLNNNDVSF